MSHDSNNPSNPERRQELHREEEAFRLRREERRLESAKRSNAFAWITNSVYLLTSLLEALLGLRFLLRLFGANPDNAFAQFIYQLSEPFIAPFSTLFISPATNSGASIGKNIFDVNIIISMIAYALLGWLTIRLIRFVQGRGR